MLDVRCWTFDVGRSMLDVRCWTFDVGRSMLDVRCWTFDVGRSMLDVRCWRRLDVRWRTRQAAPIAAANVAIAAPLFGWPGMIECFAKTRQGVWTLSVSFRSWRAPNSSSLICPACLALTCGAHLLATCRSDFRPCSIDGQRVDSLPLESQGNGATWPVHGCADEILGVQHMRKLLGTAVLVLIVVGIIGVSRDWFSVERTQDGSNSEVRLHIDRDKNPPGPRSRDRRGSRD